MRRTRIDWLAWGYDSAVGLFHYNSCVWKPCQDTCVLHGYAAHTSLAGLATHLSVLAVVFLVNGY
jgi:hypothetical protein